MMEAEEPLPSTSSTPQTIVTSTTSNILATSSVQNDESRDNSSQATPLATAVAELSDDNAALIGGIVGGSVGFLLLISIIVAIVVLTRKRQQRPQTPTTGEPTPMQSVVPHQNYGPIGIPSQNAEYDDTSDVRQSQLH
jgi:hypothetical protein